MKHTRTCKYCGKEFEAHPYSARFCSREHRAAWHREQNQAARQQQSITDKLDEVEAYIMQEVYGLYSYGDRYDRVDDVRARLEFITDRIEAILQPNHRT